VGVAFMRRVDVYRGFYWAEGKVPNEKPGLRREATMKMNSKEIVWDGFGLINLAYGRDKLGVLCM